jgi:hypothetical protein
VSSATPLSRFACCHSLDDFLEGQSGKTAESLLCLLNELVDVAHYSFSAFSRLNKLLQSPRGTDHDLEFLAEGKSRGGIGGLERETRLCTYECKQGVAVRGCETGTALHPDPLGHSVALCHFATALRAGDGLLERTGRLVHESAGESRNVEGG